MSFIDSPKIQFADNATRDAFGNLRTTQPYTIFEAPQIADKAPLTWDESVTGAGASSTYQTNQASTLLSVPNATASTVIRQSKQWTSYQPGKSQKILITHVLGTGGTGITKRVGYFEANNGVFLEQSGTTLYFVVRSKTSGIVVDTAVPQSSWNIDKFDGTGASGINLDVTKTQILVIDFQWLGVGRIRYGFSVNGNVYYCHEVYNANVNALPFMGNPNLPIRFEISNSGSGSANSLRQICCSIDSEGGHQDIGYNRSLTRGTTPLVTLNDNDIYPLIAFRKKAGYEHAKINTLKFSTLCTSTADYEYLLMVNPTVTGTAFSYTGLTNSSIEFDASRTNTTKVSGGSMIIDCGLASAGQGVTSSVLQSAFQPGTTIAGVGDVIVLAVRRLSGTTETFYGNLTFNENT